MPVATAAAHSLFEFNPVSLFQSPLFRARVLLESPVGGFVVKAGNNDHGNRRKECCGDGKVQPGEQGLVVYFARLDGVLALHGDHGKKEGF